MRILVISRPSSPLLRMISGAIGCAVDVVEGASQLETLDSLPESEKLAAADLVVVALDSPDQYAGNEIEAALGSTFLTRWICVYGPWSESDGRNRSLWPFGVRVPWQRFPERLRQEFAIFQNQLAPLPLTASRNECFLFEQQQLNTIADATTSATVLVVTREPALSEYYRQLLRQAGYAVEVESTCNSIPARDAFAAAIIDLDPWNRHQQRMMNRCGSAPDNLAAWIGITNEINPEVITEMHDAGLPTVLPKLMGESALLRALNALVASN